MPVFTIKTSLDNNEDIKIIELQGNLESTNSSLEDMEIGILSNGEPTLTIGKQLLIGKTVKLKKPLALLDTLPDEAGTSGKITKIIDEKIVFLSRPLISNTN